MRVVVWGINYAPELTGIAPFNTGLCDYLRGRGHEVEMVTAFPYYPFWRKLPGDEARLYRTDDIDGVRVNRCWHYVPRRATTARRIWHELSFGLTSCLRLLRRPAADVYVVVSPPLILGLFAGWIAAIKRRPFVFHVQDLQPDAAVGLGMVKPGLFTRLLYRLEAQAYASAALVSGISDGMIRAFAGKGVPVAKRHLFPNWIRWYGRNAGVMQSEVERAEHGRRFRAKFQIGDDVFLASYAGNLGKKQGLETLIEAAALLKPMRSILILIVGDGVMREALEAQVTREGLANVRTMKLLVEADYHGMLAASDVSLILQAPGTGQFFFPSKLLSTLSVRTPVVSVADGDSELAKAVAAGKFGRNVAPARPNELARALREAATDGAGLKTIRENTRWVDQFTGERVLGAFEQKLLEIVAAKRRL
jgi:colanic acid biosynthesis glycosyl transferase WcaI